MRANAAGIFRELRRAGSPAKAKILSRFFRTGKGEYGEGDVFVGVMVPESRRIAERYRHISFSEIRELLASPIHEARLVAILLLVRNFQKGDGERQKAVYDFYVKNTRRINNWDLVDLSADKIVGAYLENGSRKILETLARSKNLWERRIAIIATFAYIKKGEYRDTFRIAATLLDDPHDLIHKATGWMLREVGKRCGEFRLEEFLRKHARRMSRTTLRYAVERFSEKKRRRYLAILVP